jgi:hypothetical protein
LNSYKVHHIQHPDELNLNKGCFLVLLHASRIPPHVGMLVAGKYYSLNVKGRDLEVPLEALIKNIRQRKLPALFIQIHSPEGTTDSLLAADLVKCIRQFDRVDSGIATCLSPMKLFLAFNWQLDLSGIQYVYQLLELLEQKNKIGKASSYSWTQPNNRVHSSSRIIP